jgi:phosphatidylserine decarboxylase
LEILVKRKLLTRYYGGLMDKESSRKRIEKFVRQFNINMEEAEKPIDQYRSFNDFFYRRLKPDARTIGEGVVSPADGKLLAFQHIDDLSGFYVKGLKFTLPVFLQDEKLAEKYSDGTMVIVRLAPHDYHRFHFPYEGVPKEAISIKGKYYSVSPYAVMTNFAKIFMENKRERVNLTTQDKGDVLLIPVGATMVGTIIETYKADTAVIKGEEMGYFAFGGSSVVMLFEKDTITLDADLIQNTKRGFETSVLMGEKIGQ